MVLTASASSFVAGEGNVTFMVTYDGEDVTSQAAITNVTTGEPVENAAWTTTEIGEYKFQAVYDSYTSDPVTVSAIDKNKDKDKEFYRYVLLLKFTYMTCGNCVRHKDISMRWMKRTVTIFWSLPPTSLKECQWILIGVRRGLV